MEIFEIYTNKTLEGPVMEDDSTSVSYGAKKGTSGGDRSLGAVLCDFVEEATKNMESVVFHDFAVSCVTQLVSYFCLIII